MEMASYLAGEHWSDHPTCTHPLLAALARDVNDHLGDHARSRIAPLIPDVVGVCSDDARSYAWIAREAAITALPVAAYARQRVAAVGLLRCQQLLNRAEGRPGLDLDPATRAALDAAPSARDWALQLITMGSGGDRAFIRRAAPTIVHCAVSGIAEAGVPDSDDRLVDLLERTIIWCRNRFNPQGSDARPIVVPARAQR